MTLPNGLHVRSAREQVERLLEGLDARRRQIRDDRPKWLVTGRDKPRERIEEKLVRKRLARPDYREEDLTDLAGVRVVVESVECAERLAELVRRHPTFVWDEANSESFIARPRADGYRGIHLILRVRSLLPEQPEVPVELQIRTILQHHWSELSRSEFYKKLELIPPMLLERMRTLGNVLAAAEAESTSRPRVARSRRVPDGDADGPSGSCL